MASLSTLQFTLVDPQGTTQVLTVDSDTATVGSGAHCEIRLPQEESAIEQLYVEAKSGGVFAEARSLDPPVLLNGSTFTQGRLLPDSVLRIGRVELSVESTAAISSPVESKKKQQKTNPLVLVLALIGFPLGFYVLLSNNAPPSLTDSIPEAPPLWAEDEAPACPQTSSEGAFALAQEEFLRAEAKRERSPFSAEDGVLSVHHYAQAASCYRTAQQNTEAEHAARLAQEMKRTMQQQYHVHRVRLERSIATKNYEALHNEVRILLTFVGKSGTEYETWLSNLKRQIELKFSGKK